MIGPLQGAGSGQLRHGEAGLQQGGRQELCECWMFAVITSRADNDPCFVFL